MSEEIESAPSVPAGQTGDGAKAAGALIKAARERMGTHIGALAVALKVPVRKLEALEAGELAALSGPVFVRALASSVCRHLKIDPTEVLALLPQAVSIPFSQPPELKTPFRVPGESTGPSAASRLMTTPVLAVAVLLLGALAVALWPSQESQPEAEPVAQNPAREMQVLTPVENASSPSSLSATTSTNSSPISGNSAGNGSNNVAAITAGVPSPSTKPSVSVTAVVLPTPAASAPVPGTTASAPTRPASAPVVKVSAGAPVAGESGVLQFKAKDQSWIEVVDAKGDAVLRRTLQAGELANVNGVLPLRVVVGRIDATEVMVRGRKLDMATISKDNVGRFEVGQ